MSRIEKRDNRKRMNAKLKYQDFNTVFQVFCILANKTKGSYDNQ